VAFSALGARRAFRREESCDSRSVLTLRTVPDVTTLPGARWSVCKASRRSCRNRSSALSILLQRANRDCFSSRLWWTEGSVISRLRRAVKSLVLIFLPLSGLRETADQQGSVDGRQFRVQPIGLILGYSRPQNVKDFENYFQFPGARRGRCPVEVPLDILT
jgi:hypothetical protein